MTTGIPTVPLYPSVHGSPQISILTFPLSTPFDDDHDTNDAHDDLDIIAPHSTITTTTTNTPQSVKLA
jgi:hypothetical protein